MEAAMASAPAVASPQVQAPPVAASPNYTPPPSNLPQPPKMEDGGSVGNGSGGGGKIKEFFSDINILDVTISAFIIGGVLYAVHYYKFMMMLEKTGYADLSARVQKVESALVAAKKNSEVNASGSGRMKRKRALITL